MLKEYISIIEKRKLNIVYFSISALIAAFGFILYISGDSQSLGWYIIGTITYFVPFLISSYIVSFYTIYKKSYSFIFYIALATTIYFSLFIIPMLWEIISNLFKYVIFGN